MVACGERDVLQWLQEEISKKYLAKVRGFAGARSRGRETDCDPQPGARVEERWDYDRRGSQARRDHFAGGAEVQRGVK